MVAAAVGVGTAVAGVAGASMSSSASKSAANKQASAAKDASQQQWDAFQQYQQNLAPYMSAGQTGLAALLGMLGLPTAGVMAGQTGGPGSQGSGMETEQQIRDRLTPQFTTNANPQLYSDGPGPANPNWAWQDIGGGGDAGSNWAWVPTGANGGSTPGVVDQAGLDAAVQAELQKQQEAGSALTNQAAGQFSGLGSLLTTPFNAPAPFSFDASDLENTPGYQFTLQQGLKALNNQNSAQGLGLSGAQQKGLLGYATGLADNTYGQQYGRALQTYQTNYGNSLQQYLTNYGIANDMYGRLAGLAGLGQSSAAGVGNAGLQTASNVGNLLTSGANASAAGQIGSANAMNSGLSSLSNGALLYSLLGNNGSPNMPISPLYQGTVGSQATNGTGLFGWG